MIFPDKLLFLNLLPPPAAAPYYNMHPFALGSVYFDGLLSAYAYRFVPMVLDTLLL